MSLASDAELRAENHRLRQELDELRRQVPACEQQVGSLVMELTRAENRRMQTLTIVARYRDALERIASSEFTTNIHTRDVAQRALDVR